MKTNLATLQHLVSKAVGASDQIDQEICLAFDDDRDGQKLTPYTASVDECITLISRVLPDWHWHVGHGPMGVIPYASMTQNNGEDGSIHVEATAPTVPLALLGALIKALNYQK